MKAPLESIKNKHSVWFDFLNKFFDNCSSHYQLESPKYFGYQLINKVEKWAKKYPNDVQILYCDDSSFAGSIIVFIECKDKEIYHGINVVCIPQCTGEKPLSMFFYKQHSDLLEKLLKNVKKHQKGLKCL